MSIPRVQTTLSALRELGPYLLVEVLLPGGTLIALLMWLSQRYLRGGSGGVRQHALQQTQGRPVAAEIARVEQRGLGRLLRRVVPQARGSSKLRTVRCTGSFDICHAPVCTS